MVEGSRIAQIFFIDSEDCFRGGLRPTLNYSGRDQLHIKVNLQNKDIAPAKLPKKILQHVIIMAPTSEVLYFAATIGTPEIPGALVEGFA